jgi:two-component system chemotaxis response regulator CheB
MPGTDGMAVLRALRGAPNAPKVVVVSAFSPAHGARAVDALAEGAFELVSKPAVGQPLAAFTGELAEKVLAAGMAGRNGGNGSSNGARRGGTRVLPRRPLPPRRGPAPAPPRGGRLVVIACSTGGPRALADLIPRLPGRLGAGTVIVQHMPAGFTSSLAQRLDRASALTVTEAVEGDELAPGRVLLAPGGYHLHIDSRRIARLGQEPAVGGLRPRADLTIKDAARLFGQRMVLVVLTGMGADGLEGAREVRRRGGRVLVEAESTCTVYGMPRAVAEADLAHTILPLDELPDAIAAEAGSS